MDNKIKAIVFDLGNVLVDFDHMIAARRISRFTNMQTEEIFSLFFDSQLTCLFEKGKISASDFFSQIKSHLKLNLNYEEFLPIWNEIFFLTPNNLKIYHLARKFKEKYTTVLLSNVNTLHFEYLKKNFSLFDPFHKIFLSYELHLRKPDHLIYEEVLKSLAFIQMIVGNLLNVLVCRE
jgi:putative hydrolase of the HAD superfamily